MHADHFFIGILQKAHGLQGGLLIDLQPANLPKPTKLFVYMQAVYVPYLISEWQVSNRKALVKLVNVTTRTAADKLRGYQVFIDKEEAPTKMICYDDMVGKVVEDVYHGTLGQVSHIYPRPMQPCLVVIYKNKELLIPIHERCVRNVDEKKIIVQLPADYLTTLY